ncbi:MAG: hypothetical protein ACR2KZ_04525, partial [Segetibacter sp.]
MTENFDARRAPETPISFDQKVVTILADFPEGTNHRRLFFEVCGYNKEDASTEQFDAFYEEIEALIEAGVVARFRIKLHDKAQILKVVRLSLPHIAEGKPAFTPNSHKRDERFRVEAIQSLLTVPPKFEEDVKTLLDCCAGEMHINDLTLLFPNMTFPENGAPRAPYLAIIEA